MKKVECEFKSECPIWTSNITGKLDHIFIAKYCLGKNKSQCARYTLKSLGVETPPTMLPNGVMLSEWLQKGAMVF